MYNDYLKVNNLTDDADFLQYECISKMLYAFRKYPPSDLHPSDITGWAAMKESAQSDVC